MEEGYWIDRKRAALSMARNASTAEARLIHYEMAGLYSLKAAYSPSFLTVVPDHPRDTQPAAQPLEGPEPSGPEPGGER